MSSDLLDVARDCRKRGWWALPLHGKSPEHLGQGWQNLRLDPDVSEHANRFNGPTTGVGLLLGASEVVDLEPDCEAAAIALRVLAPPTGCVWRSPTGREHRLYRLPKAEHRTWEVPRRPGAAGEKSMLVELRAGNHQSVLPPSAHPDGGRYEWVSEGEPAEAEEAELVRVAALAAVAGYMAPLWPDGARQDSSLALAGAFRRFTVPQEQAEAVLAAVCTAAGDEEQEKRLQALRDTYEAEEGDHLTGLPTLTKLLGADEVRWIGNTLIAAKFRQAGGQGHPYSVRDGLVRIETKWVGSGNDRVEVEIVHRLTNFEATIVADLWRDDGVEKTHAFEIEATLRERKAIVTVPAAQFDSLRWATEHLGASAVVYAGFGARDHARAAIQLLSERPTERTVYTHLGWRKIGERWVFLHGGGALGAEGIEVDPPTGLGRYSLPDPPDAENVREAVLASLRFLDIAARSQSWPLLAAVYAASLAEVLPADYVPWVCGPTGSRKSTAAALALCHYGTFDRNHLPANLTSTGNALELLGFAAKDVLLVVDDYAPPPDPKTAAAQDSAVYRLLRGVGDSHGRNRATADARLRGEKAARCLALVTAELPPPGSQSTEARTIEIEWLSERVDLARLTEAQERDAPLYPHAMAGYLAWLAPQLDRLRSALPAWVRQEQARLPGTHGRVQESAAKLLVGAMAFLRYAESIGALDQSTGEALTTEARQALAACAARTGRLQADRRPTAMFREYLAALFAQGGAYLVGRGDGEAPALDPGRWGWETRWEKDQNDEDTQRSRTRPGAAKLGWVDEGEGLLLLIPAAAHREVTRYSQAAGVRFPATQRALAEALDREGLLARRFAKGRQASEIDCEGRRQRVWALPADLLSPGSGDTGDSGEDQPETDVFCACVEPAYGPHISGPTGGDPRPTGDMLERCPVPVPIHVPSCGTLAGTETDAGAPDSVAGGTRPAAPIPIVPIVPTSGGIDPQVLSKHALITRLEGLSVVTSALGCAETVGLDVETTGLDPRVDRLRLLSLATAQGTWLIDCGRVDPAPLFPLLAGRTLIGHNLAFDLGFLARLGFEPGPVSCTMQLAQLLDAGEREAKGKHSLAGLAERELGAALRKELQRSDWTGKLSTEQVEYAARDAAVVLPLHDALRGKIVAAGLEAAAEIEGRCLPAMVWMSGAGAPFDAEAWGNLAQEAAAEAARLEALLNQQAPDPPGLALGQGWAWDTHAVALRALRAAGAELPDTSDEALAACAHPLAALLREYRSARKLVTSYGAGWAKGRREGRVFADWRQIGAASGRMACREPNLQNIPRDPRYRACIAAPLGRVLVKADYSQIELRIAAHLAQDARMLAAYRAGEDLHTLTARTILGKQEVTKADRQVAKSLNFGLLYGMGAAGLQDYARSSFGVGMTEQEARQYREAFFRTYAGLARWHRSQPREQVETRTLAGRRRLGVLRFTEKLNTPVQGAGADGLKRALALLWERRNACPGAFPVLACHDEIVVECPEEQASAVAEWLRSAMLDGMAPLIEPTPVEVEIQVGRTWAG